MSIPLNLDDAEKVVSIIAGLLAIGGVFIWKKRTKNPRANDEATHPAIIQASNKAGNNDIKNNANQSITLNINPDLNVQDKKETADQKLSDMSLLELKKSARILFVDDDRGFKIVGILKKMGWEYVKIVTDVSSLEDAAVLEANVVFVDIHGVGRHMQYVDEGLGLALGIKRRHERKKVIIYSSQEEGKRFHEALQEADYSLPKTAEPVRFEETILRVLTK